MVPGDYRWAGLMLELPPASDSSAWTESDYCRAVDRAVRNLDPAPAGIGVRGQLGPVGRSRGCEIDGIGGASQIR